MIRPLDNVGEYRELLQNPQAVWNSLTTRTGRPHTIPAMLAGGNVPTPAASPIPLPRRELAGC